MSESWVSQVERGVLTVDSLQTAEKIAAELLLDVTYVLALDVRYPTQPPPPPLPAPAHAGGGGPGSDGQDWMSVLRRMFVTRAGGLAAGALTGGLIPLGSSRPVVDAGMLEDLRRVGAVYRRSYRAVPSESLLPLAVGQIRLALSLEPASQPEPVRLVLVRHAGEMATLAAAVQMLDLGDFKAADPLLRLAATAAKSIADGELTAVVYGCRAFHAGYSGDLAEGLDWAQAGQDAAARGASPRTAAWVSAVSSEMHASLGDADGCHRALEQARRCLERPAQDERWSGIGWLDEAKIDAYEGGDLMRLGRYDPAIERLSAALGALEPSMARHRATALVDRADALAATGEAEAACRDAGEALETVARVHHAETLRRITSVARTVRGHRSPAARAFREHLMDVRASLPTMTGTRKDTGL
jgi:tetratricopeptide (TPR) repeat protein